MGIEKEEEKVETVEKRTVINNGIRWVRFFLIPIALSFLSGLIYEDENRARSFVFLAATIALFYLIKRYRRVHFDSQNLYLIYGSKEKVIPFTSIKIMRESRWKTNHRRRWIVTYVNDQKEEKKCKFFPGNLNGNIKQFRKSVEKANPDVEIKEFLIFGY